MNHETQMFYIKRLAAASAMCVAALASNIVSTHAGDASAAAKNSGCNFAEHTPAECSEQIQSDYRMSEWSGEAGSIFLLGSVSMLGRVIIGSAAAGIRARRETRAAKYEPNGFEA